VLFLVQMRDKLLLQAGCSFQQSLAESRQLFRRRFEPAADLNQRFHITRVIAMFFVHRAKRNVQVGVPVRESWDDAFFLIRNVQRQRLREISDDPAGSIFDFIVRHTLGPGETTRQSGESQNALVTLQEQIDNVRCFFCVSDLDQHVQATPS